MKLYSSGIKYVFGGYNLDERIRYNSTSGGAFSAIVDTFCDNNYVVFGAAAKGLDVYHVYITDKTKLGILRKSKYSQSKIGDSYKKAKEFLLKGKKVLFSGTPCQIAGLKMFLSGIDTTNLLTVEVVCEGVPSPLYMRKYEETIGSIKSLDYRYKGKSILGNSKWDFELMKTTLNSGKIIKKDRWFLPFWRIWIGHLMSRPSCNECVFARKERTADITLGDLWGVHLYCPELYGKNGGASVVFANTEKGKSIVVKTQKKMFGHELKVEDALKYQAPMRKHIDVNPQRNDFMNDLKSNMTYEEINQKWGGKTSIKILWHKYIWGNRQKVWLWNLTKGKYKIR